MFSRLSRRGTSRFWSLVSGPCNGCHGKFCTNRSRALISDALALNMWPSWTHYYPFEMVVYFIVPIIDFWLFCGGWFQPINSVLATRLYWIRHCTISTAVPSSGRLVIADLKSTYLSNYNAETRDVGYP